MSEPRFRTVLLFGAPGVGKGTQGSILDQQTGFFHLSSGEIFRSLDEQSPEGREVEQYASRGDLVPDELTVRVWQEAVKRFIADGRYRPDREFLLLDGIPRNVPQAEILSGHIDVLRIVCLYSSDEDVMVGRIKDRALKEGRSDDADEAVIRRRFEVYRAETEPVLDFYPAGRVVRIDALPTPDAVSQAILNELIPLRDNHFGGGSG